MKRLPCLLFVTIVSAFLQTFAWGQSPRVMVELAFVVREHPSENQPPLKEEFGKLLPQSDLAKEGLIPFLDDWLRGRDRDQHDVDLMQLKIPLGEEVEFTTRHSLSSESQDPKAIFEAAEIPRMPGEDLLGDGLEATVRTKQRPDGKIRVRFRFGKRMPATTMPSDAKPGAPPVPVLHRRWVTTTVDLEPRKPVELHSLLQSEQENGKRSSPEMAILVRVHLADPAAFPLD